MGSATKRIAPSLTLTAAVLVSLVVPLWAAEATITPDELAAVKAAEAARIETIQRIYGTVVAIYGNDRQGGGSGVLYDPAGHALTNFHVVSAAGEEGWAGLADGKLYRWKLLGFDPGGDLAIIKLTGKESFPAATIGNSGEVEVGDWAMAVGNPFTLADDQSPTVTLGVVSGVQRYQPGSGKNALIYGNCIQVDSSINPGNSGGPLFNMAGEIIGINGRGSFQERGRVNVGVGYAISSEQAKNFLPDLLATKICMHGTLDAVFQDRNGETICYQMNLDSPIARQGLRLGDRLVSFNGVPIRSANQFTNMISTLPAGWPVEVSFEREGVRQTVWIRLDALPYDQRRPPQVGKPDEEERPGQPSDPAEASKVVQQVEPGKIRDAAANRREAERILTAWRKSTSLQDGARPQVAGGRLEIQIFDDRIAPEPVDRRRWVWSVDGRFRDDQLDVATGEETGVAYGYDGRIFWRRDASGVVSKRRESDFKLARVDHAPLLTLCSLYGDESTAAFEQLTLEGSDKAADRGAFRIRGQLKSGQGIYLWFSVIGNAKSPEYQLLKLSTAEGDVPVETAWLPRRTSAASGIQLPLELVQVVGLAEKPSLRMTCSAHEIFPIAVPQESLETPASVSVDAP